MDRWIETNWYNGSDRYIVVFIRYCFSVFPFCWSFVLAFFVDVAFIHQLMILKWIILCRQTTTLEASQRRSARGNWKISLGTRSPIQRIWSQGKEHSELTFAIYKEKKNHKNHKSIYICSFSAFFFFGSFRLHLFTLHSIWAQKRVLLQKLMLILV